MSSDHIFMRWQCDAPDCRGRIIKPIGWLRTNDSFNCPLCGKPVTISAEKRIQLLDPDRFKKLH